MWPLTVSRSFLFREGFHLPVENVDSLIKLLIIKNLKTCTQNLNTRGNRKSNEHQRKKLYPIKTILSRLHTCGLGRDQCHIEDDAQALEAGHTGEALANL